MGHSSLDFHGFCLDLAEREWQPGPTCYHTVVIGHFPGQYQKLVFWYIGTRKWYGAFLITGASCHHVGATFPTLQRLEPARPPSPSTPRPASDGPLRHVSLPWYGGGS
eukprot:1122383-Prymnesium_polylepis.3